jgi:hypothetical protein
MQPCLEHWLAPTPNRIKIVVSVQTETFRLFLQPFLYFRLFLQPFLFQAFSSAIFVLRLFLQPFLFQAFSLAIFVLRLFHQPFLFQAFSFFEKPFSRAASCLIWIIIRNEHQDIS